MQMYFKNAALSLLQQAHTVAMRVHFDQANVLQTAIIPGSVHVNTEDGLDSNACKMAWDV